MKSNRAIITLLQENEFNEALKECRKYGKTILDESQEVQHLYHVDYRRRLKIEHFGMVWQFGLLNGECITGRFRVKRK